MLCLSHPILLMSNRSTGYLQPVVLCTRPVDTGHFLMHHPKWSVATNNKTTCSRSVINKDFLRENIYCLDTHHFHKPICEIYNHIHAIVAWELIIWKEVTNEFKFVSLIKKILLLPRVVLQIGCWNFVLLKLITWVDNLIKENGSLMKSSDLEFSVIYHSQFLLFLPLLNIN